MSGDKDEAFLARWARRKREQSGEPDAEPGPAQTPETVAKPAEIAPAAQTPDSPACAVEPIEIDPANLPRVDDLTSGSDLTAFLRKGVPEELKRLAMRRMWSLDPAIRDFVEVAENQYDWNVPGGVPGYGPLAEGTDIEALLAQATGVSPAAPPDQTMISSDVRHKDADPLESRELETESVAAQQEHDAQQTVELSSAASSAAPETTPEMLGSSSVTPPLPEAPRASSRRRHGGALPRDSVAHAHGGEGQSATPAVAGTSHRSIL